MERIVILGAGVAGVNAAAALRGAGFLGLISLVGEETELPYQRPPLSKVWLTAPQQPSPALIRPASFYAEQEIDLKRACKAIKVDRTKCEVQLADGGTLPYDALIFATGARPRQLELPGIELRSIHYLRDLGNAAALRLALNDTDCRAVTIVGAGVIGLEVASAVVGTGKAVTVIEAAARPMARVASPATTNFITDRLREDGVTFLFNKKVAAFEGRGGHVKAVSLADGTKVPSDLVLVGAGAEPNVELAQNAGLVCDNGICVDRDMRTSDPNIYAIGDCARGENPFARGKVRIETIHNALNQARIAAAVLCNQPQPVAAPPRFWSDLKGMKVQIMGIADGYENLSCDMSNVPETLEVRLMAGERLLAVETVNLPARQNALLAEISATIHS